MIYLTRRERFCAAHRMFRQEWSDEVNQKVFGKCSNPNWHGHNYVLWVTVKGEPSLGTWFCNEYQYSETDNSRQRNK